MAAINALDADVVGLMEIENSRVVSGTADAALDHARRRTEHRRRRPWPRGRSSPRRPCSRRTRRWTSSPTRSSTSRARSRLVGTSLALGTESGTGEAFDNAREPIGQVFKPAGGGEPFLVVVNHFKSKGSAGPWPGDADPGDGQGASNESASPPGNGTRHLGRLRDDVTRRSTTCSSSATSTPTRSRIRCRSCTTQGYVDLNQDVRQRQAVVQLRRRERFARPHPRQPRRPLERVTGADIWNINAPESIALEYSRFNYHGKLYYTADPYRSSDHDPVIAALPRHPAGRRRARPTSRWCRSTTSTAASTPTRVKWAGTVAEIVDSADGADVLITGAGDLVGASLFASAVAGRTSRRST